MSYRTFQGSDWLMLHQEDPVTHNSPQRQTRNVGDNTIRITVDLRAGHSQFEFVSFVSPLNVRCDFVICEFCEFCECL